MVDRVFTWVVRHFGLPTLIAVGLLSLVAGSTAYWLADIVRGLDATLLVPVGIAGILFGWWLASTSLSDTASGGAALIVGAGGALVYIGRLLTPLADLLWQLLTTVWWWGVPLRSPPAAAELRTGTATLLDRLSLWLVTVARGEPGFDPIAVALVWAYLFWLMFLWSGWAVRRRAAPVAATIPVGLVLSGTFFYSGADATRLLPLLASTLFLLALVGHIERERRWHRTGVDFSREIRTDLVFAVLPLTAGLLFLSVVVPAFSVRGIVQTAQRIVARPAESVDPVADSLGVRRPPADEQQFASVRTPGLPREHLIGAGPELSEEVVLEVQVEEAPTSFRPYWRSFTYDWYTGRGWRTDNISSVAYEAGETLISEVPPGHRLIRQTVEEVGEVGDAVYAAGGLVTVNHSYAVARRSPDDVFGARIDAERYQADAVVPVVGAKELRPTSSEYPDWVVQRYLALPDDVPDRVRALALDLTATEATPFDRAHAIEEHLRTYEYTLDLPAPPLDRDIADYFLFDLQKGYCDYYATTMVVLARAAGLPARLAVGYVAGTYDDESETYTVTAAEAHSWPEVYFAGYGWIPFEPTAGRPALEREVPVEPTPQREPDVTVRVSREWWQLPARVLGTGVLLVLAAGAVWAIADAWRLRRLPPTTVVATIYGRVYGHGRRIAAVAAGDTPYEFTGRVAERVAALATQSRLRGLLSPTSEELRSLTSLYVQALYSPYEPGEADKARALRLWGRLRPRLWLARIRSRFG